MTSVCLVAGEASGDKQAALLVAALQNRWRGIGKLDFWGVAGPEMRAVGVRDFFQSENLAVMGLVEVVSHYFEISKLYKNLLAEIEKQKPDVLIVVDYPGFNMRLIADVFGLGVKVFYHIPPKVWAHGAARVEKLAAYSHLVTCILPFEEDVLRNAGVVAKFIGNPLFDSCEKVLAATQKKQASPYTANSEFLIGLCPGSRKNEINYVLPALVTAFQVLVKIAPHAKAVLPVAHTLDRNWLKEKIRALCPNAEFINRIELSTEPFAEVVSKCDYAWVCSGTATLETAFLRVPHSIVYIMNSFSFFVAKQIVRIPYIGLANWCAGKMVVPEFLQNDATPEHLVAHACELLLDEGKRNEFLQGLDVVRARFPAGSASHAAEVMIRALSLYSGSDFEKNWLRDKVLQENWL